MLHPDIVFCEEGAPMYEKLFKTIEKDIENFLASHSK